MVRLLLSQFNKTEIMSDLNIGDKEMPEQDNRMTPHRFMQKFDYYAGRDASRNPRFYPPQKEFGFSGIKELLSEIKSYGLTNYQNEVVRLLQDQQNLARNGDTPLSLVDLKQKLQSIFGQH